MSPESTWSSTCCSLMCSRPRSLRYMWKLRMYLLGSHRKPAGESRRLEGRVALHQPINIRPIGSSDRDVHEPAFVMLLEAVTQHRPIVLTEQAAGDLYGVVRTDPENVPVI